jgi:hypothetical protein
MALEVSAMTVNPEHGPEWSEEDLPTEELARRQGVHPIASLEDLDALAHPELWDSDEEYEEFLADLYASRRASIG